MKMSGKNNKIKLTAINFDFGFQYIQIYWSLFQRWGIWPNDRVGCLRSCPCYCAITLVSHILVAC